MKANFVSFIKHRISTVTISEYVKKGIAILIQNKTVFWIILVGTIFVDGFFIRRSSDIVYFGVVTLYVILAKVFRSKSNVTFLLCLGIFLGMAESYLTTQASAATEKLTVWLFLFMLVGIFQGWSE